MDPKFLTEAILGNRPELFKEIWPVYKQFLEDSKAAERIELYFLDRHRLVDDFYRWLHKVGRAKELGLIDRRSSGPDRRGDVRPDAPGRRMSDAERAQQFRDQGKK